MIKSDVNISAVHRKFSRSYLERLAVYQPYKHILKFPLLPGNAHPRQDKKNLNAGKYYRIMLQLCAYATFLVTTAETFPSVQVFCCIHVWTDFADFASVDTLQ